MKKLSAIFLTFLFIMQTQISFGADYQAYKDYIKATIELKKGDVKSAQKDYENVVAKDPKALAAYKDLSQIYAQGGNKEAAVAAVKKIEELDGDNPLTTNFIAGVYFVMNDSPTAKTYWDKTLKIDPYNETAIIYLASYYSAGSQELEKAAEYWKRFLKQQPDNPVAYLQLGLIQERQGKSAEAMKSFDKAVTLRPETVDAYTAKARLYEADKKLREAISEYEKYSKYAPGNPFVYINEGKNYFELGEYDSAKDLFLQAKQIKNNDTYKMASYWLGMVYEKQWAIDKAAAEFEDIAKVETNNNPVVFAKLGYYYSMMKQYDKAEYNFLKALGKDGSNSELEYLIGLNYLDWGKPDKALQYLSKVAAARPDFSDVFFFKGVAYDKKGDFANAEINLKTAIALDPKNAKALNYLGYMLAERNIRLNEAEDYLTRAVILDKQNGHFLDSLGRLYYQQGRYELAARALLTAIGFARDPLIYEHLGDACMKLEKYSDAWVSYAVAYDMTQTKNLKNKLADAQKFMPADEYYKQMLARSESNFLRVFSVKASYIANVGLFGMSKIYVRFDFQRGKGASLTMPATLGFSGAVITIAGGNISYEPAAVEYAVDPEFAGVINFAADVLNTGFSKRFADAKVVKKGSTLVYTSGDEQIIINIDTAMVEKISKGDMSAELSNFKNFMFSKLPTKIKIKSKSFSATFETKEFALSDKKMSEKAISMAMAKTKPE